MFNDCAGVTSHRKSNACECSTWRVQTGRLGITQKAQALCTNKHSGANFATAGHRGSDAVVNDIETANTRILHDLFFSSNSLLLV